MTSMGLPFARPGFTKERGREFNAHPQVALRAMTSSPDEQDERKLKSNEYLLTGTNIGSIVSKKSSGISSIGT